MEKIIITYLKYPNTKYTVPKIVKNKTNTDIIKKISLEVLKNFKGQEIKALKNLLIILKINQLICKDAFDKNLNRSITSIQLMCQIFPDKKSKKILLKILEESNKAAIIYTIIAGLSKFKNPELFFEKIVNKIDSYNQKYTNNSDFNPIILYYLFNQFGNKIENKLTEIVMDNKYSENLKIVSIKCLGNINSKKSSIAIASLHNHSNREIKLNVFKNLNKLGYSTPLKIINHGLKDTDKEIVIESMKCIKYSSGFPKERLIKLLLSDDWSLSLNASFAFADYGNKGIKILEKYAKEKTPTGIKINSFLEEIKETNDL